ncbi:MAG TPA: O-antigen ligase family protein [Acetobacteraceae bacterium]
MLKWQRLSVAFLLVQGNQAFGIVDRLVYGEWEGKPGDKLTQSLNLLAIVLSFALLARGLRRIRTIRRGAIFLLIITGFLACSFAWSINPQTTVRESFLDLVATVGWIGIATTIDPDEYLKLAARMTFLAAVASLMLLVVSPSSAIAVGQDSMDFRGIFSQKNVLGEAMAIGAIAQLHCLSIRKKGRVFEGFCLALTMVVALMSKSATSCLVIFVCCVAHIVIAPIRRGGAARVLGVAVLACIIPAVVVGAAFPDSILELLGKDPTLTGRTEIWAYVINDISMKPLLGWGYEAFWGGNNPAAIEISDAVHWTVPQAHNGLLEMLLQVGFVGSVLYLALLVRMIWLSIRCMRSYWAPLGVTTLLGCVAVILTGVSEAVLLAPFEASTGLFVVTGLFCERALHTAGRRQRRLYSAIHPNEILQPAQVESGL